MSDFKTPKEDTLRGTGYGSLGWSEGYKLHNTAKRMVSTFDVDIIGKDKGCSTVHKKLSKN